MPFHATSPPRTAEEGSEWTTRRAEEKRKEEQTIRVRVLFGSQQGFQRIAGALFAREPVLQDALHGARVVLLFLLFFFSSQEITHGAHLRQQPRSQHAPQALSAAASALTVAENAPTARSPARARPAE